ncbi:MAG: hypothetical protein ACE5OQ_02655 [Woeseia sp.]
MSNSGSQHKRGTSWARKASGLVLVAWLNLAVQPCVMAMELDNDQNCPHCPTEVSQDQRQAMDCSYVDSYNYDSRNTQPKPNDLPRDAPVIVDNLVAPSVSEFPPKVSVSAERAAADPGGPPLNILYCVYLD